MCIVTESPSPTSEPPVRCDLCGYYFQDGDLCSTWVTPSTSTYEEAMRGSGYWFEDPEWALCATCDQIIQAQAEGVTTDVEAALAVFTEWRKHNVIAIFPKQPALERQLNAEANEAAVRGIQMFLACRESTKRYDETVAIKKETPEDG